MQEKSTRILYTSRKRKNNKLYLGLIPLKKIIGYLKRCYEFEEKESEDLFFPETENDDKENGGDDEKGSWK